LNKTNSDLFDRNLTKTERKIKIGNQTIRVDNSHDSIFMVASTAGLLDKKIHDTLEASTRFL